MSKVIVCMSIMAAVFLTVLSRSDPAHGQGATVQGDILRGEGAFLRGMGWYELNDARAASINADTMIKIEKWNKEIYDTYMREHAGHMAAQKRLTDKSAKLAERKRAEREQKLRTSPDPGDIQKGEAMNALLVDLSPGLRSSIRPGGSPR